MRTWVGNADGPDGGAAAWAGLPPGVAVAWERGRFLSGPCGPPEEEVGLGRVAPKRLAEFRAGRRCARAALGQIGIEATALPRRADRAPAWPAGFCGAITHCRDLAAAVAAPRVAYESLGLDAEPLGRIPRALASRICVAEELEDLEDVPPDAAFDGLGVLWCAKEAVYKCLFPLTGQFLDFTDVRITLDPVGGTFRAAAARIDKADARFDKLLGGFGVQGGHLQAWAALPAPVSPPDGSFP